MQRVALVAVVAFASGACSAPPQADVRNATAATAGPRGPAPLVERGGPYGLATQHLPAIATDGSQVVAAVRESDGERGLPNLTLVVKNRRDEEVARHVVLSVAEADTMLDDADGKNPPLDARVARANAWLADQRFEAMRILAPEATNLPSARTKASGDGVTVSWGRSHLRITDGPSVIVDQDTPPTWLPDTTQVGSNRCQRSAYLGGAAIARAKRLAVVTISYVADSDFCLTPPDAHHVVIW